MVLANAHLDGIPASGSPGLELLADLFNKPIEEMRAAKEAEVELPECLKREATAEETARIDQHAKDASPERELIVRKTPAPKAGACQEAAPPRARVAVRSPQCSRRPRPAASSAPASAVD